MPLLLNVRLSRVLLGVVAASALIRVNTQASRSRWFCCVRVRLLERRLLLVMYLLLLRRRIVRLLARVRGQRMIIVLRRHLAFRGAERPFCTVVAAGKPGRLRR